jgi:TatD DNase family protein
VVAIGETGLDWYWSYAPLALQRDFFQRHLALSQATGLPFIVHMREADELQPSASEKPSSCCDDIYQMIAAASDHGVVRGVMHSYTGSAEMMKAFCALGMCISFAGMVTYKKSAELRAVAAAVPSDRILVETDAPYLSPEPVRGRRPNEPSFVVHTARCLAETRDDTLEDFALTTTRNALRLFWNG